MPTKTVKSVRTRRSAKGRKAKIAKSESVRLDVRINHQTKTLIERAAAITGQTLTDYAISNLVESAMATIERHERLVMTDRDRDRFLAALDRPAKPLPALERAARRHAQATRGR